MWFEDVAQSVTGAVETDHATPVSTSYILETISKFYSQLPSVSLVKVAASAQALADDKTVTIGAGFTGAGVLMKWVDALCHMWQERFGAAVDVVEEYQCDCEPEVQDWLVIEWPKVPNLYKRVEHLACPRAQDVKTGTFTRVPYVRIFVGGFVCKSKSGFNSQRGKHTSCVQDGSGSTGESWSATYLYICKAKPKIIVGKREELSIEGYRIRPF